MKYTPTEIRQTTLPFFGFADPFGWCLGFLLILAMTLLIIRGHGCHPGGHEEDIDDELVHREYPAH